MKHSHHVWVHRETGSSVICYTNGLPAPEGYRKVFSGDFAQAMVFQSGWKAGWREAVYTQTAKMT